MTMQTNLTSDTVAVVLAGGEGVRLRPLTRHVCKPALPFGGGFRSIDFTLSNCVNSGVRTIGVATQYKPEALLAHLAAAWDSTRCSKSLVKPWQPREHSSAGGYRGTADAVYRNLDRIEAFKPRLVLVLAGDHVYKMDYRPLLAAHCARGADVTVGCVDVAAEDARHFGVLTVDDDGGIERFIEKPQSSSNLPRTAKNTVLASMGIYVFNADFLKRALTADAHTVGSRHDFGADIIPKLVSRARTFAYAFRNADGTAAGYWRDIGTPHAYWQAHMDLLGPSPMLTLHDSAWPMGTMVTAPRTITSAVLTATGGVIENSIAGTRCAVDGRVHHSVVFDGAQISRDATVVDSIVLPGARIGAGSRLRGVIVDTGCSVPERTVLQHGGLTAEPLVLSMDSRHEELGLARYALAR